MPMGREDAIAGSRPAIEVYHVVCQRIRQPGPTEYLTQQTTTRIMMVPSRWLGRKIRDPACSCRQHPMRRSRNEPATFEPLPLTGTGQRSNPVSTFVYYATFIWTPTPGLLLELRSHAKQFKNLQKIGNLYCIII